MKKIFAFSLCALFSVSVSLSGCAAPSTSTPATVSAALSNSAEESRTPITLTLAAAASLAYSCKDALIPMFQNQHPEITVQGDYNSSGKLQTQIEEGMQADVFLSAARVQMERLVEGGFVDADSVVNLLENEIVLIVTAGAQTTVTSFADIGNAEFIALGDPESVPAGQYSQEILTNLGVWEQIQPQISWGSNVTEVLHWVGEGSAQAGIVYATDAATTEKVEILAAAPQGSLENKVLYPAGVVASTTHREAADLFMEFLQSDEAMAVFESYGFKPVSQ